MFAEPSVRVLPWTACLCVGIGSLAVDDVSGLEAKEVEEWRGGRRLRSLGQPRRKVRRGGCSGMVEMRPNPAKGLVRHSKVTREVETGETPEV